MARPWPSTGRARRPPGRRSTSTLEPCAYRSVRGGVPCVERTLNAGTRRVVSAIEDPNPRIAGLGHALLRTAGVRVTAGLMADEAARIHAGHFRRVRDGLPHVTLKIARTADGFAGGPGRARVAISCAEASAWVHLQRAHHDAIMIGVETALADNPQLTVRLPGMERRSPVRVVLDSRLRMRPRHEPRRHGPHGPTWIVAAEDAPAAPEAALTTAGVEVMRVGRDADGRLDLREALALLAARGITRVFSEGGPTRRRAAGAAGPRPRHRRLDLAGRARRAGRRRGAAGAGRAARLGRVPDCARGDDRSRPFRLSRKDRLMFTALSPMWARSPPPQWPDRR